jgi:hypothetical protein
MTTEQFKAIATANLNKISTSDLMTEVKKLTSDFSDSAQMVWDIAMNILMERLPEAEYVDFCNNL